MVVLQAEAVEQVEAGSTWGSSRDSWDSGAIQVVVLQLTEEERPAGELVVVARQRRPGGAPACLFGHDLPTAGWSAPQQR